MKKKLYLTMAIAMIMAAGSLMMNVTKANACVLGAATAAAESGWMEKIASGTYDYESDEEYGGLYSYDYTDYEMESDSVTLTIAGRRMQIPSNISDWEAAGFDVEYNQFDFSTGEGYLLTLPGYNFQLQAQIENDMVIGLYFNRYDDVINCTYPEISIIDEDYTLGQPTDFCSDPYKLEGFSDISTHDSNNEQIDLYLVSENKWYTMGFCGNPTSPKYSIYGYNINDHYVNFLVAEDEAQTLLGFCINKYL